MTLPPSAQPKSEMPAKIKRLAIVQLILFVLALLVTGSILLQISPLLRKREELAAEVTGLKLQLARSREAVAATRIAINAFHEKRYEDAVKMYEAALQIDPDNAYILNLQAYSTFKIGDINDAIEIEQRSVATDPEYAWGYFDLARFLCAARPSRYEEANAAIVTALHLRPDLISFMRRDGEFKRHCSKILPDVLSPSTGEGRGRGGDSGVQHRRTPRRGRAR